MVPEVRFAVNYRLLCWRRGGRAARLQTRLLMIVNLLNGRQPQQTATVLHAHRDTV